MDEQTKTIPHRDETSQSSNSDKTAQGMAGGAPASAQQHHEISQGEEPSGYRGENPAGSGPGGTGIRSATPENAAGHMNPSAPGDTGTTPGTTPHE